MVCIFQTAADESISADEEGKYVSMETSFLEEYTEEETVVFIGQLADLEHPMREIDKQHGEHLFHSFRPRGYNYTWWMMSFALQANGNPSELSDESILDYSCDLSTLRDGYVRVTLDGQHQRSCVFQVYDKSDQGWDREPLRVQLVTSLIKKVLNSWKVRQLGQVVNFGSALACLHTSIVELVVRILYYSHTFVKEYGLGIPESKDR